MNKLIFTTALAVALGAGGVAVAQTTADVSAPTGTQPTTSVNTDVASGTKQVPAPGSRNCVRDTGSHITNRKQACLPVNGQSYSREDLDRTGNPNLGQALQQLDPNVRIGH
jgi:hypothetical protein